MDDVWRAIVGGLVTIVVGFIGWELQQGGLRRRRRREIQEELALLGVLGPEFSDVSQRIQSRLAKKIEQYEPARQRRRVSVLARRIFLAAVSLGVIAVMSFGLKVSAAATIAAGTALGVVLGLVESWLERRRELREQDAAVREVSAPAGLASTG